MLSTSQTSRVGSQKPHRILCLEDNRQDQELLELTLAEGGIVCDFIPCPGRSEFETALTKGGFDLIISDFSIPGYDGLSALATARKTQPQTPFIFVSGTIGEERAVESLKSGATDYVLKDRPDRLVSAVQRALREVGEREERKKLEEQLRQAQKMEAIGQLAGGVAHDFNNLLAVIQGNAQLALMNNPHMDDATREYFAQITAATQRAAGLTRQLLAFSRKQPILPQPIGLNDLIGNLTKMLNRIIGSHIELTCRFDGLPFIQADPGMIEQVIFNLVVNARDAMPRGGQLLVSAKNVTLDENSARVHPDARPGRFACLSVVDSGTGIAPQHLPHIFEPFFTTKEVGKGTGLGLATVYGIVKQHQGWIELASELGKGTTFRIYLPAIAPPASALASGKEDAISRRGSENILLVEDDPAVRLMTQRTLESFGYHVLGAESGKLALKVWQNHSKEIDLLLTDMVMPDGISGRELALQLCAQRPALKVIYISGYPLHQSRRETNFIRKPGSHFLEKPVDARKLVESVRQCLDERDVCQK